MSSGDQERYVRSNTQCLTVKWIYP